MAALLYQLYLTRGSVKYYNLKKFPSRKCHFCEKQVRAGFVECDGEKYVPTRMVSENIMAGTLMLFHVKCKKLYWAEYRGRT